MAMRAAAPLLSLLGHELRAPAGVIGGYLILIDRAADRLSPEQMQALAGARRAQLQLVEVLDHASRLLATWQGDDATPVALSLTSVLEGVGAAAVAQALPLTVDVPAELALQLTAVKASLVDAVVSVAAALAREHGADVALTVSASAAGGAVCHIRPATTRAVAPASHTREPFNWWRPGLGLRLVVAATVLVEASAQLEEVLDQGRRLGVDITFAAGG
ncbi:MAG: hypothetical protein ABI880_10085 [Acidobacteriota bacterium]